MAFWLFVTPHYQPYKIERAQHQTNKCVMQTLIKIAKNLHEIYKHQLKQ